jgi:uncharacterized protein (TIGR02246 family)
MNKGGLRHDHCKFELYLDFLTYNGFPNMRTRSIQFTQLAVMLAWGWLGGTAAIAQQVPSAASGASAPPAAQKKGTGAPARSPMTDRPEDEKAIQAVAEAFRRAFDAGDAKKAGELYADDAELIDEHGNVIEGRPAIEDFYSAIFQARQGASIEIAMTSLRFLGADVAKEEGRTRLKPKGGDPVTIRHYTVLFGRQRGRWVYSSVREEHEIAVSHHERLKNLEWMIGEWLDQSPDSTVHVSCRWSEDKNFLLRHYTIHSQGQPVMTISQRIGWDPLTKQIKSWFFDSEGGYGDALWMHNGARWIIKSAAVTPDGQTATATNILARVGPNKATWKSTERTLGGQSIPESAEYVMIRKHPAPQTN